MERKKDADHNSDHEVGHHSFISSDDDFGFRTAAGESFTQARSTRRRNVKNTVK